MAPNEIGPRPALLLSDGDESCFRKMARAAEEK